MCKQQLLATLLNVSKARTTSIIIIGAKSIDLDGSGAMLHGSRLLRQDNNTTTVQQ
jgi:hypothetical protein